MAKRQIRRTGTDAAALSLIEQDIRFEAQEPQRQRRTTLALDRIADRPLGDTRPLNSKHIEELVSSIAVLGLITPLTVDRKYCLLAGAHRRAALQRIFQEQPDRFQDLFPDGVPVRVMDVDSSIDAVDALQIEVEENTQRRNYTAAEIREAARKLENAGYEQLRGRPKAGQKSLHREIQKVFRLSDRRIRKILNATTEKGGTDSAFPEDLLGAVRYLNRLSEQIGIPASTEELQHVQHDIARLVGSLKRAIAFHAKTEA